MRGSIALMILENRAGQFSKYFEVKTPNPLPNPPPVGEGASSP
jgi:hypothetical protein